MATKKKSVTGSRVREKRSPHYSLKEIQETFTSPETLRATRKAEDYARALGYTRAGIVRVVQSITRVCFYKSMTTYQDHTVWHDVYRVPDGDVVLYVKFTVDESGKLLISFKEK